MKPSDLPKKWWHRLALTFFWLICAAGVLCLALSVFVLFRDGFASRYLLQMGYTVAAGLAAPIIFWGFYRLILWIAVGGFDPEEPAKSETRNV